MKKITILKKDYARKRRAFYDKVHHEEQNVPATEASVDSQSEETKSNQHAEHESLERDNSDTSNNKALQSEYMDDDEVTAEAPKSNIRNNQVEPVPHTQDAAKKGRFNLLWLLVLLLLLLTLLLSYMLVQDRMKPESRTVAKKSPYTIINDARKEVVSVVNLQKASNLLYDTDVAETPAEVGIGSGVIYKVNENKALIITNYHVIKDAEAIEITTNDNEKLIAKVVGSDEWTDIAVLSVPKGKIKNAVQFADSDKIKVGETAIAIGSPLGQNFAGSVSKGIISGMHRNVPVDLDGDGEYDWESQVLQTDAAINPGNSGGALVNADGKLIGINAMKISLPNVEGIGFAIPSNEVKTIAATLEKEGKIKRPQLGIMVEDLNNLFVDAVRAEIKLPEKINKGVIITDVEQGSLAEALGLNTKDLIVKIDNQPIENLMDFRKILFYQKKKGEIIEISYYHQGTLKKVQGKLK